MWTAIQLTICVIFLIIVAFWVGRLLGKRKYLKLHEEMKAYELSFNQLVEEMELASNHNLKVLEKQSEDLTDLLTIADKKILRVNDFLKELDEACVDLKRKSTNHLNSKDPSESGVDRKFRQEMGEALNELSERIRNLYDRLQEIEDRPMVQPFEAEPAAQESINYALIRDMVDEEVAKQVTKQLTLLEQQMFAPIEPAIMPRSEEASKPAETMAMNEYEEMQPQEPPVLSPQLKTRLKSNVELKPAAFEESLRMPTRGGPELEPSLSDPKPGTPLYDVLKMAEEGITIPQIARSLSMGKGQVELILKMYGSRINMRNVV